MLPRLLIDEPFRVQLADRYVAGPYVRSFWLGEYASYGDHFRSEVISAMAPIDPRLRNNAYPTTEHDHAASIDG